jgi:energy-coupling factor transport system substrate-specific component
MTWQLGAFAVLAVGLAGGFAWYESKRPDARVVALVATLAAFAALGRIAFAAVPNVKPTTDIVLIAGFALGPAPGFVVGAVAGLTSNFFFGQGPWTPWQMAAWGATGLLGAALGALTRRRIGRWALALVCLVVGFAFTVVQDVGDWVNYSDHSLRQLGVYLGKGVGFDAVHAAGCFVFALAFGPALARSLGRFVTRLQVRWRTPSGVVAPVLLVALLSGALALHSGGGAGAASAAASPTTYLLAAQNRDGGFGPSPGQPSTPLFSGWAALGLAAEGYNASQVRRAGHSLIAYLEAGVRSIADPGSLERTILAAVAAGDDPRRFAGHDLVAALEAAIRRDGSVSDQTNLTAFAVLALRAAHAPAPPRTLRWLIAQEDRDGGFNFGTAGGASDVDDTAAVLEALAADSKPAATRVKGRASAFIDRQQNPDGGFPASGGAGSNAQSTAWAVQGLLAVGRDPSALHRRGGPSPLVYLESLVAPDGHVRYSRSADQTPVWVTAEAAMALAGKPLPLRAVETRAPAGHPAPSARAAHRKPGHLVRNGRHARRSAESPRRAVLTADTRDAALRLLTDAGILDALALAPIGLG